MKSALKQRVITLFAGFLLSSAAVAFDQPQVEYSADTMLETAESSMKGKIYAAPGKERREMGAGGETMVSIMRHDKKVSWMLMPQMKMYMEMPVSEGGGGKAPDLSDFKMEFTEVGPEQLNGIATIKSKVVMSGKGSKMGGFAWRTKEGVMVKLDAIAINKGDKMRFKQELTNLKIGKQDAALFEIPSGYKPMSIPGMSPDMMKQMMKR